MPLIVRPYVYTNQTVIDALQLDANLDVAYNLLNGNLDEANIKSGINQDMNGFINVKSPAYKASGSSQTTTGSINAGSNVLTLGAPIDFANGQGIAVNHAGAACTLTTPGVPTVTPTGATGATAYQYQIVALDANGGCTTAGTAGTTATGNATLSTTNYNALSWTAVASATSYAIYGRVSGTMNLLAVVTGTTFNDTGAAAITPPSTLPSTPPATTLADTLVTTISSGSGSTSFTLALAATTTVTNVTVQHDDTVAIQNALTAAGTAGGGIVVFPRGTYNISSPITINSNSIYLEGSNAVITGSYIKFTAVKNCKMAGLTVDELRISGVWFSEFDNIAVNGMLKIDGYNGSWGTAWNRFTNMRTMGITIDITLSFVNLNYFNDVRSPADGTAFSLPLYGLYITGTGSADHHANNFVNCDFSRSTSSKAVYNDTSGNQPNILTNCYFETNKRIVGNFHLFGVQSDSTNPIALGVSSLNNIISSSAQTRDFSQSPQSNLNLAIGGSFVRTDINGKPQGFTSGATLTVAKDTTAPNKKNKNVSITSSTAFAQINVACIGASGQGAVCGKIYYQGQLSFVSLVGGGIAETYPADVDTVNEYKYNGWNVYRFAFNSTVLKGDFTLRLYLNGASPSGSATLTVGRVEVTEGYTINLAHTPFESEGSSLTGWLKETNGDVMTISKTIAVASTGTSPHSETLTWATDLVSTQYDTPTDTITLSSTSGANTKGHIKWRSGPNDTIVSLGGPNAADGKVFSVNNVKYTTVTTDNWTDDCIVLGSGNQVATFDGLTMYAFTPIAFLEKPTPMMSVSSTTAGTAQNTTKEYFKDVTVSGATATIEFATNFTGDMNITIKGRIR